jgi:lipopolysaccharide heptosyltransferase II
MNLRKVLIINPFGIGDVLFTTPVINALNAAIPGVRIGYLCNSRTAEILRNDPFVDSIFIYDRDQFESVKKKSFFAWLKKSNDFIEEIRDKRFDAALDFSLNSQYGFFCWAAGIKKRVGFDYKGRGLFLTDKVKFTGYSDKHVVQYYADLLKLLGLVLKDNSLRLYIDPHDLSKVENLLVQQGIVGTDLLIGLIPGAGRSWGKDAYLKHWPANNFSLLADKLVENYKAKIIIIGDFKEVGITKEVISGMSHKAIDFSGETTIGELSALISKMKLVVANDGGPLHMAAALGLKTLSMFGPVDDKIYGPYPPEAKHIVIKNDISCRPCYKNFRYPVCNNNHKCLEDITVDQVYEGVKNLLSTDMQG